MPRRPRPLRLCQTWMAPLLPEGEGETTLQLRPEPTFRPGSASPTPAQQQTPPPSAAAAEPGQGRRTDCSCGRRRGGSLTKFIVNVNFVEVPVTVKDSKGNLVAGLTQRDFKVFENNVRYPLRVVQRGSTRAVYRLRHRPEPDRGRDGQGERLAGRLQGALTPMTK
jgi:hypothetical protein